MSDLSEPVPTITRPRLMPNKAWTRPPSAEEAEHIPKLEERYIHARALFERYDDRAKGSYNQNPAPIVPDMYLRWLRMATRRYNERNAEIDPSLRRKMKVTKATLAGLGYIDSPPRHCEVALTVAPYRERERGPWRGFVTNGDRLHGHHTPKYDRIAGEIEYPKAVSVAIGEQLHQLLHFVRDPQRANETRRREVDGDFDFITPHILALGYTEREIERAREKAHDLNNDLGLYRGGK